MKCFNLTPLYLFAVMALLAFIPLAVGANVQALGAGVALLVIAALLVEPGKASKRQAFGMCGEIGASVEQIADEYKKVSAGLKDIQDKLKAQAEVAEKEARRRDELSAEVRQKTDELLKAQADAKAELRALEQKVVDLETNGASGGAEVKSLGRFVVESDAYASNNGREFSCTVSREQVHGALTSDESSAGPLIEPTRVPGIVAPGRRRLFLRDMLSWGRTESNAVEYVRESGFTNNAAPVSENPTDGKPTSDITFEGDSEKVATVAHLIHASEQVLSDASMLMAYLDNRMRYGLKLKEELQLLKGSGTGLDINGLYTQASSYDANLNGLTIQSETRIDRLRLAMLQAALAEYDADGIVLSQIDWAAIELTKDKNDQYLWASPSGRVGPGLWGLPVVATNSMTTGEYLVGAFQMGAQGWDRQDAIVEVFRQNKDNVEKNMVTIRCEERLALTVFRPEAFVKGTFSGLSGS